MEEYQKYLKSKYKSLELISPLELLDRFSTEYINLTLVGKEEDDDFTFQKHKICESVTLTEALNVEGYKKKAVLILGGPGMGKSTLAINICKQWAENDLLQDYNAVILLTLRDKKIQGAENIKDLLLTLDDELRESIYKEIVKSNGEKTCFILEGYDELPYHLQRSSVFAKLLEELLKCTVVCTSRPEAFLPYRDCKVIKINGFNKESIDKYISKAFEKLKNGEEMACKLKSQIQNNPVIKSILQIPINVAILCLIFSQFSTLPKTLTELYTLLCKRLILRYIVTRTPNVEQVEKLRSLDHLPTGISEQFSQLCYVAYKGMVGEIAIFFSEDLTQFGVDESNLQLRKMGLLLIVPSISADGREMSYSFLHLTVQEFCAAWHISKLCPEEQMKLMSIYYYYKIFRMVWRFYCGITKLQNKEIFDYILPYKLVKSPLSDWKASELAHIAYEAGSREAYQIVGDYYKDGSNVIKLDKLESHVINYVLTQYSGLLRFSVGGLEVLLDWSLQHSKDILHHSLEDIMVKHCDSVHEIHTSTSYFTVIMIELMLRLLSSSKTLELLCIQWHDYNVMKCLANNNTLHDLRMNHCQLDVAKLDIIGEMLSHNQSIRSIDLSNNCIKDDGVEKLVHHLMSNSTLHHINLCSNDITEVGAYHLSKLMIIHSSLTSIELSNNPLKDKGVHLLLQSLPVGTEHIGLCDTQMTSLSCQSLVDAFHKVKSISFDQLIDFTPNRGIDNQEESLTDKYLKIINDFMKSTNSTEVVTASLLCTSALVHLEIRLTNLASHKLINVIGQNESIKTLKLHYCMQTAEDSWTAELAQYIRHNKSLTKLIISANMKMPSYFIELLADSLAINTSIKSMIYEKYCHVEDACKLINKLKENDTLEELTLREILIPRRWWDMLKVPDQVTVRDLITNLPSCHILEVEKCAQEIIKARGDKSMAKLKVNIIRAGIEADIINLLKIIKEC